MKNIIYELLHSATSAKLQNLSSVYGFSVCQCFRPGEQTPVSTARGGNVKATTGENQENIFRSCLVKVKVEHSMKSSSLSYLFRTETEQEKNEKRI